LYLTSGCIVVPNLMQIGHMAPVVSDRVTDRVIERQTDSYTQVIIIPTKRLFQRRFAVKMLGHNVVMCKICDLWSLTKSSLKYKLQ